MEFIQSIWSANNFAWLTASSTSFFLIFAAEIGDKSQLVCMTLAARYRARPVFIGAVLAFAILNLLAVIFGLAISNWVPKSIIVGVVAITFAVFGVQALLATEEEDDDAEIISGRSLFVTSFLMIVLSEFGDKTQLAVVALSANYHAISVWIGATLALICTSALGVYAGAKLVNRVPIQLLHRISGVFFLVLAAFACYQLWQLLT